MGERNGTVAHEHKENVDKHKYEAGEESAFRAISKAEEKAVKPLQHFVHKIHGAEAAQIISAVIGNFVGFAVEAVGTEDIGELNAGNR